MQTLTFKVSDAEAGLIRAKAKQERVNLSEYLRRRATGMDMAPALPAQERCEFTGAMIFSPQPGRQELTTAAVRAMLATLNVRALASTPVSRAWRLIIPRGMRLSICLRTITLARVGGVLFITPYRVAGISTQHQPAFSLQIKHSCGMAVKRTYI